MSRRAVTLGDPEAPAAKPKRSPVERVVQTTSGPEAFVVDVGGWNVNRPRVWRSDERMEEIATAMWADTHARTMDL
jgi:hypothetical protein